MAARRGMAALLLATAWLATMWPGAARGGEGSPSAPPAPAAPSANRGYPHARVKVALPTGGSGQITEQFLTAPAAEESLPTAAPAAVAESPPEPRVLAIFEGRTITERDVMGELWRARGKETLEWLIGRAILEEELGRLGLEVTEAEVDERLARHIRDLEEAFPSLRDPDALTRTAAGMRLEEYRDRSVWVELALRKILAAALPPGEDQLRGYFAETRGAFIQPERVRLSQLFIAPRPDPDHDGAPGPEDWARAEKEIVEAHSRLRMGEDFRSVASACPSASFHTRWVQRGELLRELEDTAFQLRPGSLSAPLKSPLGYHIIRTEERRESRTPEFAEVRDQVRERYEEARFVAKAGEFLSALRDKALRSGALVVADAPEFSGTGLGQTP